MNPFTLSHEDRVGSLGETALIEKIRTWLGSASPDSPAGIGDDCSAVLLPNDKSYLLTTADPVIYQRHFDESLAPEDVAKKLLRRNISDIAAMGGTPKYATLSLAIPNHLSIDWLQRFYSGLSAEADQRHIQINGGDVSPTDDFVGAFMTLIGFAGERILERKGGLPGSRLFVTGTLGGSRLKKHYSFEPRLVEGQWLANHPAISSCMDLSDGLGKDCAAILFDHCSAVIDSRKVPVSSDARKLSATSTRSALDHAVNDGEDFELLFTLDSDHDPSSFENEWRQQFKTRISQIGQIAERVGNQPSVTFSDGSNEINLTGYDPFRTS